MAKRNCRRSDEEKKEHEFAVKVRKMTDHQIFDFFYTYCPQLIQQKMVNREDTAQILLKELESGSCKGIGPAIIKKIRTYWEGRSCE